jgi:hypothetical protein
MLLYGNHLPLQITETREHSAVPSSPYWVAPLQAPGVSDFGYPPSQFGTTPVSTTIP